MKTWLKNKKSRYAFGFPPPSYLTQGNPIKTTVFTFQAPGIVAPLPPPPPPAVPSYLLTESDDTIIAENGDKLIL